MRSEFRTILKFLKVNGGSGSKRSHSVAANLGKVAFCRGPIAATQGGVSLWITEEQISKWPPDGQAGVRFLLAKPASEFVAKAGPHHLHAAEAVGGNFTGDLSRESSLAVDHNAARVMGHLGMLGSEGLRAEVAGNGG